jgi:hypothetical protein
MSGINMSQRVLMLVITCFLWTAGSALAQEAIKQPTAIEVVNRASQMSGGMEAFQNIKTIVIEGKFSIPQATLTGSIVTKYSAPDRARVTIDLGKAGTIDQGVTPRAAWESTPSIGHRALGKSEASRLLESVSMRTAFEPQRVYEWITHKGIEKIDDEDCHHLEMKRSTEQTPDHIYYSLKSGLPVKTVTTRSTASGTTTIDSQVSGYKEFDGITLATKVTQVVKVAEAQGMTYEIQIDSVKINTEIDDAVFAEPESAKPAP